MHELPKNSAVKLQISQNPFFQNLLNKVKLIDDLSDTRVLVELGKQDFGSVSKFFEQAFVSNKSKIQWIALRELFETSRSEPQRVFTFLNSFFENYQSAHFSSTRILVELGKQAPHLVIETFDKALSQPEEHIQWAVLLELAELTKVHPTVFIPLLGKALEKENPSLQWPAALALIKLRDKYPELVQPIFIRAFDNNEFIFELNKSNGLFHLGTDTVESVKGVPDLEWEALLELIDLAKENPEVVIPIIENSLSSENPHVQWLAMLELLELAKIYPEQIIPTLNHFFDEKPKHTSTRVLVEMNKTDTDLLPLFEKSLNSNNPNLYWAALFELTEIGKVNHDAAMIVFEKIFIRAKSQKFIS